MIARLEARWLAKGVADLRDSTCGQIAPIYKFACGPVAYFAPGATDFLEVGELKDADLTAAQRSPRGSNYPSG